MQNSDRQSVFFPALLAKPVKVAFDEPATTSDGGALLLGALDKGLGLIDRLASKMFDGRQASKVVHEQIDMFRQRVHGIACGYALRAILGRKSPTAMATRSYFPQTSAKEIPVQR